MILLNVFTEGISPLISGSVCLSLGCSLANSPYPPLSRDVSSCAASASPFLLPSLFLALTLLAQSVFSLLVSVLLVLELHSSSVASPAFYVSSVIFVFIDGQSQSPKKKNGYKHRCHCQNDINWMIMLVITGLLGQNKPLLLQLT